MVWWQVAMKMRQWMEVVMVWWQVAMKKVLK